MNEYKRLRLTLLPIGLFVGFAISLLIPSTAVLQKYLDILGVAVYIAIASLRYSPIIKTKNGLL